MPENISFSEHLESIVGNFINTAVLIDENAAFLEPDVPHKLKNPGYQMGMSTTGDAGFYAKMGDAHSHGDASIHSLDAKAAIDSFAGKGIICSIIKPKEGEINVKTILKLLKKTDVVILDWMIYGDDGDYAISVIEQIKSEDKINPRLRQILIYTGEDKKSPFDKLKCKFPKLNPNEVEFSFEKDGLRIAIYSKNDTDVSELPNIIVSEFAKMSSGILSSVAINSLSLLRNNSHSILKEFKDLDPAYLSHRCLLPVPDDAIAHASDIVSFELKSFLERNNVGSNSKYEYIRKWLKSEFPEGKYQLTIEGKDYQTDDEGIGYLLTEGHACFLELKHFKCLKTIDNSVLSLGKADKQLPKVLTGIFCKNGDHADIDNKFSMLTQYKYQINQFCNIHPKYTPKLTFGTVLVEKTITPPNDGGEGIDEGKYLLCIQPACDCVRITEARKFLFLSIDISGKTHKFDIIIPKFEGGFHKGLMSKKVFTASFITFNPNEKSKSVIASTKELCGEMVRSLFYFESSEQKISSIYG